MKIPLVINLDPRGLKDALTKDGVLDFIMDLDHSYQECDFTLKLVERLIHSLKNDLEDDEKDQLIEKIANTLKND